MDWPDPQELTGIEVSWQPNGLHVTLYRTDGSTQTFSRGADRFVAELQEGELTRWRAIGFQGREDVS